MKSHLGFKRCSRCQLKKQGMHHNLSTIISIKTEVKIFVNLMLIAKEAATSTAKKPLQSADYETNFPI